MNSLYLVQIYIVSTHYPVPNLKYLSNEMSTKIWAQIDPFIANHRSMVYQELMAQSPISKNFNFLALMKILTQMNSM